MLVRQSASCAGWQLPHASGASDASSGVKRAGAGPWGRSGVRQWRATNDSTDSPRAPSAPAAQPATSRAHAGHARDRMRMITGHHHSRPLECAMTIGDVTGIGWRANAARRDGVVHARVLAALSASLYVDAAGEVLWIGEREATPHARAIHVAALPEGCEVGARVSVAVPGGLVVWRPADGPATAEAAQALRRGAAHLAARAATLGSPRGFGGRPA